MVMNLRRIIFLTLSAALILSGSMAYAADILKPATPSLTAPAPTTTAPTTTTTTTSTTPTQVNTPVPAMPATTTAATGNTIDTTTTTTSPTPGLKLSNQPGTPSIDPKDIPDIVMTEMKDIESSCEKNYFYSSFHDCKCIAVKFLDARLKSDPGSTKDSVFNKISGQCVDEPAIAGYVYKSCGDYMQHVRKDYVEFCKCSANNVAETYHKAPVMSLRYIESLRRNAFIACGIRDRVEKPDRGTPRKYQ